MEDEQITSPSLKNKLRRTLCLSCCFRANGSPPPDERSWLVRASSMRIRSPEIKDKCKHLISRIGRHHHHRRHSSSAVDFRYDPLSYSLNFDEGFDDLDEAPLRSFSARPVPVSPPPLKTVSETDDLVKPREITCV
ncbi:hypothetical protein ACSBR2_005488 [Camellia fascicularis]